MNDQSSPILSRERQYSFFSAWETHEFNPWIDISRDSTKELVCLKLHRTPIYNCGIEMTTRKLLTPYAWFLFSETQIFFALWVCKFHAVFYTGNDKYGFSFDTIYRYQNIINITHKKTNYNYIQYLRSHHRPWRWPAARFNTVQSGYLVALFLQITHKRHSIARPWGRDMECLREFKGWPKFYHHNCCDVRTIVLYMTAIYR